MNPEYGIVPFECSRKLSNNLICFRQKNFSSGGLKTVDHATKKRIAHMLLKTWKVVVDGNYGNSCKQGSLQNCRCRVKWFICVQNANWRVCVLVTSNRLASWSGAEDSCFKRGLESTTCCDGPFSDFKFMKGSTEQLPAARSSGTVSSSIACRRTVWTEMDWRVEGLETTSDVGESRNGSEVNSRKLCGCTSIVWLDTCGRDWVSSSCSSRTTTSAL